MALGPSVCGARDAPQLGGWAAAQLGAYESHSVHPGDVPLAAGPGGQSATSVPPPDSILPRISPSSQIPALQCMEAQLDFGGKDSEDTRSTHSKVTDGALVSPGVTI